MVVEHARTVSVHERARLDAVRRYDILDTPPDGAFDRVTAVAARVLRVPVAIISIVDSDRIWFKSHHGVDVDEIGREPGLCASAILGDEPWLVTDARTDPRTLANPLVAGEFGLRFYAGVPLRTRDGHNLGTLCVIDREPRDVAPEDVATLADLATVVMDELELRLSARRTVGLQAELRHQAEATAASLQESLLPPTLPAVPWLDMAARYHVAQRDRVGGDFYDVVVGDGRTTVVVGDACGKGTAAAATAGAARWALHGLLAGGKEPATAMEDLNSVLARTPTSAGYVTVAAACLVPSGSSVDVAVAVGGHPHPLIVRRHGVVEAVGLTGPLVGWFPDSIYRTATASLAPGDAMVLFTDGLVEAIGGHGTGDDGVRALLGASNGCTAGTIADRLDQAIGGRRRDDAAFVVVRVQ